MGMTIQDAWANANIDADHDYVGRTDIKPKVKPLVWGGDYFDEAKTPFCSYFVSEVGDGRWKFSRSEYPYHDDSEPIYKTCDQAKAAAQADYEHRILIALA